MIKFAKVRNVKSPKRNSGDAGIDFFVPEECEGLIEYIKQKNPKYKDFGIKFVEGGIYLPAGANITIPTGLKYIIPQNVALIQFTKSGVGSKKFLDCFNGVGDASYQGELHISIINEGFEPQVVEYGEKITQFVPVVYNTDEIECQDSDENFFTETTARSTGGFGSTGNK